MASIIVDAAPKGLLLSEVRQALCTMADKLNSRRTARKVTQFATVCVGEELAHPATGNVSFLVSFSDKDRTARRYLQLGLKQLDGLGKERLLRSEEVSANWYSLVRFDPCLA